VKTTQKISRTGNPVELLLALAAGLGVIGMMIALAIGVIDGPNADSRAIGLLFLAGFFVFIVGAVGWFAVAQPHKHFDDINVPLEAGSHHDTAIVVHEPAEIVVSESIHH
jgi:hypothetical protein